MNDSDKFQQLGLDDLEEVSGGEALSDRAVAFTNDHERFGFSNATVWQCNKSDLDYTLFRE